MEAFIRFWRFLLRIFLGLIFVIQCILLAAGREFFDSMRSLTSNTDIGTMLTLVSSLFLLLALALFGALGLFLLEIVVAAAGGFGRVVSQSRIHTLLMRSEFLSWLLLPIPELAKQYFQHNHATIVEYYYLKSWAQPEVLGQVEGLDEHMKKIEQHFGGIADIRFIEYADYFSSVTQEQVKRDQLREEIREIYYLLIVVLITIIIMVTYNFSANLSILSVILFLFLAIISFIVLAERRRRFAVYTMLGYLDAFTLGQGATVEDRDAI